MEKTDAKADMHLHSRFSTRPSEWVLRKIGCAESYSDPLCLYETARSRGMDFVTITDHNTIAGSLEIAHLDGTFVSEEITTYFPKDGCKIHVLAYDITEAQHEDISRIRENLFDLVVYLRRQKIVHAVAHPLFSVNDRLQIDHIETLLVLFQIFEINGTRDGYQNNILRGIINNLKPADIELFMNRHNVKPLYAKPWIKHLIGGSDDHSSLTVARTFTIVQQASTPREFLDGILKGKAKVLGKHSNPKIMAHHLYSIAYQFYRDRFSLDRYLNRELLVSFAERALTNEDGSEESVMERLRGAFTRHSPWRFHRPNTESLKTNLRYDAREIILDDPQMKAYLKGKGISRPDMSETWYRFVDEISEKVLKRSADSILKGFSGADIFDIFQTIGSAGSLYTMLSPYFLSYHLFTKDRAFCRQCRDHFDKDMASSAEKPIKVAHFTDTLHDLNGVAKTIQMEAAIAEKTGKPQKVITCGPVKDTPGVVKFAPVGTFDLPEYPDVKLYYPPLLKMLDYCYREGFTHIHSATPGPVGLAALAVAQILKLPIYGTYHTALPQYAKHLTEDAAMEDLMWKYTIWYYNQMDVVYVPSHATGTELENHGIAKEKIRYYPRGIDVKLFHPSKRNGFLKSRFCIKDNFLKVLYVGRISREKDLEILSKSFAQVCQIRNNVHLVVVGEGPYLAHMKEELAGYPVTFTGVLTGEDLAQAYASCDLFAFPSRTDTFGNVVLEAQASGLPVVITDEGGPRENMVQEETGLAVPGGDSAAFQKALLHLIDNPKQRREMAEKARAHMEGRTFETAFMKLWESYGSCQPTHEDFYSRAVNA